ncbi:hypothetical protein A3A79_03470 [Candidatus Gottesmanbacteria bacterium RIFCSPLOWO2_01_FULL_43_11b]|uniref:DDH domain-containing protein n=1 Tax=Candidatus Gottesmanbacteria bacterium RIFCSPLOWO2_01_FULL_43_11b TaxID=1798392 RepID=A0A1F6AIB5_9BACT|nr:MAG: hypothetical protein A3A79_03470 [Candidatus Gottesmanbacteria bacterium RIFCSPLOWO2_01_FULL_43_11b]
MDTQTDLTKIKELLDKVQEVLIVTHDNPTFDSIGSSLALSLGLSGLGKKVTVACIDPVTVSLSSFVGVNKITTDLAKKNFIISLDYVDGSIEKVSYNIEGNKFNLVIEPRPGFPSFSPDKVNYSYAGGNADVIIAVDTIHLGGLGKLYEENKELFAGKPMVNVDYHPNNSHFGAHNVVDHSASSTAELVAELLSTLGAPLTADIATNLLNAVYGATDNFQKTTISAGSFELAAVCLKAGGKRFTKSLAGEETPSIETVKDIPVAPRSTSSGQAPADWLKPKIFKSSNLI